MSKRPPKKLYSIIPPKAWPAAAGGKCNVCGENVGRCVCYPTDDGPDQANERPEAEKGVRE